LRLLFFSAAKNQIIREQQRAKANAGIGDIERGPVIVAGVYQNEIDHKAETHAIGQVS